MSSIIKDEKKVKGKQKLYVSEIVKSKDASVVGTGLNLFGERMDEIGDADKIHKIIQLGNLHIDRAFYNPQDTRVYSAKGYCPTLTLSYSPRILITDDGEYRIRRMTGVEEMRMMGLEDEDIQKLVDGGISNNQLCLLAGNSIVVDVMAECFKEMIKH